MLRERPLRNKGKYHESSYYTLYSTHSSGLLKTYDPTIFSPNTESARYKLRERWVGVGAEQLPSVAKGGGNI